jgi:hypothetical protein
MNESIENMIYFSRGHRVMLDRDLARLYGVETKRLNEQLQRNRYRFPEDFAFKLTKEEWDSLMCQIGTSKVNGISIRSQKATLDSRDDVSLRSQFATSNVGRGGRRYLPYVFTEHGVVMLANVLRSKHAVRMSIEVVRTFIQMRKMLISSEKFGKELGELKDFVLRYAQKSDQEFRRVWQAIEKLGSASGGIEGGKNSEGRERRIGFELQ